jgi:hypothetical protein
MDQILLYDIGDGEESRPPVFQCVLTFLDKPIGIVRRLLDKFQRCGENPAAVQHGPRTTLRTMCKSCQSLHESLLMQSIIVTYMVDLALGRTQQ